MPSKDDRSGFDRLGERIEDRADKTAGNLADSRHPVLKVIVWGAGILAILFVVNAIGGFISIGGEAIKETQRVLSIKNVREQRTAIIQDWQDLLVATGNACGASRKPPSEQSPTFVEGPEFAYAATARKARVDYNRRQNNLFEAEKVGPPGYPSTVPDGPQMDSAEPDWCEIAAHLHEVHE